MKTTYRYAKASLHILIFLILSSIQLTAQTGNTPKTDVLGHGFDIRYVDALNWGASSKGRILFNGEPIISTTSKNTPMSYHFVTNPYEFEKKLLQSNNSGSPFQAVNSDAFYQAWDENDKKLLFVYTQKKVHLETKTLHSPDHKILDSALVADFKRLGRDITPEGFLHRYGTHYATKVAYGGIFLKRNLINNDDFIYSPYFKDEFKKRAINDIVAMHTNLNDPDPYIQSGNSSSFTVGGETDSQWVTTWKSTVAQNKAPIEVTLQTFSELFKNVDIPDIEEKERKIKLLDSIIDLATKKAQHLTKKPLKSNYFQKYSLRFKQDITSLVKKRSGPNIQDEVGYTGDLFFGGFSKDEAILKTAPLISLGGLRLETLITDEKVNLNKSVTIIAKPEDLKQGYVSIWDDTKKLIKGRERKRLRVSGPEEAKTRYSEALIRNISKKIEIKTIDGDLYEIEYTLALKKEKEILENFVQNYNNAMQTQLVSAATVGDTELLESLFQNNKNRRIPGLIQAVITTNQSPTILNLILDNGVIPTIEDLELLFEREFYNEQKILILLERGSPFKNNMIYKAIAYKSDKIIYALLREGAEPRNNDLAFALDKYHYPTVKALMSVDFEAFDAGKNELLLAAENNDEDLAQKFVTLGATADAYILNKVLQQNNEILKNVVVPVTEADDDTLLVVAEIDNTELFKYFISKNAKLKNNAAVEIATDNNNIEILNLALKNGGNPTEGLDYAISKENDPAIKISLANKAKPDAVFIYAAKRNDISLFNDALNIHGGTPSIALEAAVREDRVAIVQSIIKAKQEKIELSDVMSLAVSKENMDMIELLVANNANPTEGIKEAVRIESEPITAYLISKGAETINPKLIQEAVKKENLNLSRLLIEKGNSDANEAIVQASNTGNIEITKYLLQKGADTKDALDTAMESKDEDIILLLLNENKAIVDSTYIATASRKGNYRVVKELIDKGQDPTNGINNAILYKQQKTLETLINNGGVPTQEQLKIALEYGFIESIQLLLNQKEISASKPFSDGSYPVHAAISLFDGKSMEALKILSNADADFNSKDADGNTILHIIANQGSYIIPIINYLLQNGSNPKILNNKGASPLDYVQNKKVKSVIKKALKK